MEATLKDTKGKEVGKVELADGMFGIEPNMHAMHQVVREQRASARAGTASTKTRSDVRGGGKKPWRQKGTGNARVGSIRSPLWKGGGVIFGPHPRDYSFRVPRKVRRLAFNSALSAAAREGRLTVLEDFEMDKPSTKQCAGILEKLKLEGTVMVVVSEENENIEKSFRNLRKVEAYRVKELNTYDLLRFDSVVFIKSALEKLMGNGGNEGSS